MLENLKQLVKESAEAAIVNNSEVPNEQNDAAIEAASGSILDTLKGQLTSGNVANLVEAFKGGDIQNSAIVQEVSSAFIEKLGGMGINTDSAKNIASSLIPDVIDKFVNKTKDPNDSSFNWSDIVGKVAGGADGKLDLSDLTDLIGGNNTDGEDNQGGSLLGRLKGLFR